MSKHTRVKTPRSTCSSPRDHEHDAFLFLGAVVMGTWVNIPQAHLEHCEHGHPLFVWRRLRCGCMCVIPVHP